MTPNPGATAALITEVLLPAVILASLLILALCFWRELTATVRAVVRAVNQSRGLTGADLIDTKETHS